MKKRITLCFIIGALIVSDFATAKAQTIATFETLTLPTDSFWNGSSTPFGASFTSGNAIFANNYDAYWKSGFAYSNKKDSITAGYTNMYAARTGSGYAGSEKYAVGQQDAMVKLTGVATGKAVQGVYVTNTTFAAMSMKNGDSFAKKFGGANGTDPDWFKLTVSGYYKGNLAANNVDFYLADFRFANNEQDYIVNNWRWVDLTPLGNIDSLKFTLTSSDVGNFGINTPTFFCIDNFTTADSPAAIEKISTVNYWLSIYPNPVSNILTVKFKDIKGALLIEISDITGKAVYSEMVENNFTSIGVTSFATGIYNLKVTGNNFTGYQRFIKQ